MPFGHVVLGPPGSGKSTFCHGVQQFLSQLGRSVVLVNLDPANDLVPYHCDVSLSELVSLELAMQEHGLGPNGALLHCLEQLEKNFAWLEARLSVFKDHYFVFDCPGQAELFTSHVALKNVLMRLSSLNYRLATVQLVDASHCADPFKFVSVLLLSLQTMVFLECPHINLLSKMDLAESQGPLALPLDVYTSAGDLDRVLDCMVQSPFGQKHARLSRAICELVDDFGLVSFVPLAVEDKDSMVHVMGAIDKANGYIFGAFTPGNEVIFETAVSADRDSDHVALMAERYLSDKQLGSN